MDTHQGVSGAYTIRRCTFGHMGLNAIGRGQLTVEESTLYGRTLVNFRQDYGSTWEGDLIIRNCRWIPACGDSTWPHLFGVSNDGMHDFGYPCSMPKTITIDGLLIEDRNTPAAYDGPHFCTEPDGIYDGVERIVPTAERPYPYALCQEMRCGALRVPAANRHESRQTLHWRTR